MCILLPLPLGAAVIVFPVHPGALYYSHIELRTYPVVCLAVC